MILIIFSNLTLTTKFKKLALRNIRGVKIIQTPRELSTHGCSYSVKAPADALGELFTLMNATSLYPVAIYRVDNLTKGKISYTKIK